MSTKKIRTIRRLVNAMLALILFFGLSKTAFAQDGETAVSAVDTVWVLIAAFLVFFMQAGFGFLEAGFVRAKNVVNIMAENLMDTTMTTMGFIIAGVWHHVWQRQQPVWHRMVLPERHPGHLPRINHSYIGLLLLPVCLLCRGVHHRLRADGRTYRLQSRSDLQLPHRADHLPHFWPLGLGRRLAG